MVMIQYIIFSIIYRNQIHFQYFISFIIYTAINFV